MFLFWLFLALAIGAAENISDSCNAYKNPYVTPDCFKPKPWQQDWVNRK
mgnify:CR=1 FL=1